MILLSSNMFILELKKAKYLAKISSIIYIIVETYIDIIFAIFIVSKFIKKFRSKYIYIINQILYYLTKNQNRNIIFRKKKELKLIGYSNLN